MQGIRNLFQGQVGGNIFFDIFHGLFGELAWYAGCVLQAVFQRMEHLRNGLFQCEDVIGHADGVQILCRQGC